MVNMGAIIAVQDTSVNFRALGESVYGSLNERSHISTQGDTEQGIKNMIRMKSPQNALDQAVFAAEDEQRKKKDPATDFDMEFVDDDGQNVIVAAEKDSDDKIDMELLPKIRLYGKQK